jgi:hypothetical protein
VAELYSNSLLQRNEQNSRIKPYIRRGGGVHDREVDVTPKSKITFVSQQFDTAQQDE